MSTKLVINKCYGGFEISPAAIKRYWEIKGKPIFFYKENGNHNNCTYLKIEQPDKDDLVYTFTKDHGDAFKKWPKDESYWASDEVERDDPILVQVVEELGEAANGEYAELKIVEIPEGVSYNIEEYDGIEWVAESHQTWG